MTLMHVSKMGSAMLMSPQIDGSGAVTDFRPQTLFYGIRFLDAWLAPFADKVKYDEIVLKEGYRDTVFPHPGDMRGNAETIKKLFLWHDLQARIFPELGISPKVYDNTPINMSPYRARGDDLDRKDFSIKEIETEIEYLLNAKKKILAEEEIKNGTVEIP